MNVKPYTGGSILETFTSYKLETASSRLVFHKLDVGICYTVHVSEGTEVLQRQNNLKERPVGSIHEIKLSPMTHDFEDEILEGVRYRIDNVGTWRVTREQSRNSGTELNI